MTIRNYRGISLLTEAVSFDSFPEECLTSDDNPNCQVRL
ncbi:hypothetical protein S1OALGB6SA_2250 [Olavius algarvensis spirochete endosymbiont]|nr:MAG: hypothetical protein [Olavius algarvensis spirochete endosymbiont]VDB01149.1 hypothetical protein S1OALGB6SA_2250 [Olavius algarvensis spirochete endosymbiont]